MEIGLDPNNSVIKRLWYTESEMYFQVPASADLIRVLAYACT